MRTPELEISVSSDYNRVWVRWSRAAKRLPQRTRRTQRTQTARDFAPILSSKPKRASCRAQELANSFHGEASKMLCFTGLLILNIGLRISAVAPILPFEGDCSHACVPSSTGLLVDCDRCQFLAVCVRCQAWFWIQYRQHRQECRSVCGFLSVRLRELDQEFGDSRGPAIVAKFFRTR